MPPLRALLARNLVVGLSTTAVSAAHADTGVQVGARGGIQLQGDGTLNHANAPVLGAEVRFGFELSPLIMALSFDHFFVKDRTLFQVGANALYDLPLGHSFLCPYVGAGLGITRFALPEVAAPPSPSEATGESPDSNGMRLGLNLVGGVRFEHVDVPVVRPFAQLMASVGPIDLLTVIGGVLFEVDGP